MKRAVLGILAVAFVAMATVSLAKADTFDFVYSNTGLGPVASTYGTVVLTNNTTDTGCSGGCINITVTAASGYAFFGNNIFGFNVADPTGTEPSITFANLPTGFSNGGSGNEDGFGKFDYTLNSGVHPSSPVTSFSFDVSGPGATLSLLEGELTTQGGHATNFAAQITPDPTIAGCTGYVAAGGPGTSGINTGNTSGSCGGSTTATPEPASLGLFGIGLLGLAFLLRRHSVRAV